MKTKISEELLLKNNWSEAHKLSIPGYGDYVSYEYNLSNNLHLSVTFGFTNSGRIASLHIDNESFETIASADIDTIEQFNLMMKVIESKYELN